VKQARKREDRVHRKSIEGCILLTSKVLLIGLDAATFDLIEPWSNDGKLPTFRRLVPDGASGELLSVLPITPAAWTSAA
jgi:predicted AlkP superfamily phosphohydrolase/phosphomutase